MTDQFIYTPERFDQKDLAQAKQIILTVPPEILDDFWRRATIATADLIIEGIKPTASSVLLDFGCGIGRVAKELIGRVGCRVVGVDISTAMRKHALRYVASDRFSVMSSEEFNRRARNKAKIFTGAYSIIVLQHVLEPRHELQRIAKLCKAGAPFFIYNCVNRCLPTNKGWTDDGQDVGQLTAQLFDFEREFAVPHDVLLYPERGPMPGELESHWFRLYRNTMAVAS
jgi:SAM-dependent methyltransferase